MSNIKSNIQPKVRCNACKWEGTHNELQWVSVEPTKKVSNDYQACPNCLTDAYLMNISSKKTHS